MKKKADKSDKLDVVVKIFSSKNSSNKRKTRNKDLKVRITLFYQSQKNQIIPCTTNCTNSMSKINSKTTTFPSLIRKTSLQSISTNL